MEDKDNKNDDSVVIDNNFHVVSVIGFWCEDCDLIIEDSNYKHSDEECLIRQIIEK